MAAQEVTRSIVREGGSAMQIYATELMGAEAYDAQGHFVGRVREFFIEPADQPNRISHFLLSRGRFQPLLARYNQVGAVAPGTLVRAEPGPLSQVLLNLMINAAQATEGKGRITVRGKSAGGQVQVEVQDTGPGIPAEVMGRLFEPFFTTTADRKGTGLGLAISRHLMSQMGGQLVAANSGAGGALFTLTLPQA